MSRTPDYTDHVVVGTDGSPTAEGAIDWAARRAARDGDALVVLTAVPEVPLPTRAHLRELRQGKMPAEHDARVRGERRVANAVARVRAAYPDLAVEGRVDTGEAWESLVAATHSADVVVVGSRGESAPLRARALGGHADAVVTRAHGPVVVVPQGIAVTEAGPVIVGFDGSDAAQHAIRIALSEADAAQTDLVVVHAWDPVQRVSEGGATWTPDDRTIQGWIEQTAAPFLAKHAAVSVRYLTPSGQAAHTLIERSREASLVVVGSRGRGGVAGLLLGSVSRAVLRGAHCPVLVTRGE